MAALPPFLFHWYNGAEPPLVGVTEKVIALPSQTLVPTLEVIVADAVMVLVMDKFILNILSQPAALARVSL